MRRRDFIRLVGAGTAAMAVPRFSFARRTDELPNVLFIALEDNNDWVGCLGGHPDALTPNIDMLAANGCLFTNAHCTAPICNPSRTSLLSGVLPSTNGIYDNGVNPTPVFDTFTSLPRHFKNHDYRTACSGKIYHAWDEEGVWDALYPQTLDVDVFRTMRDWNGLSLPLGSEVTWGPIDVRDSDMRDYKTIDWAVNELNGPHPDPFFLAFGFRRAHYPWIVPREYFEKFDPEQIALPAVNPNDLDDVPPIGRSWVRREINEDVMTYKQFARAVAGYLATINFIDTQLGRFLDAFYSSPYVDDTIVVLWSDHGYQTGEKQHWKKRVLWEETTHVPMIFIAPGVTTPGSRCDTVVSLLDIYPTLIDLCGLNPMPGLEGETLLPQLLDPTTPRDRPAITTYLEGNHAIRDNRWRYIRYVDGTEELYDHYNDDLEWTNLANDPQYDDIKQYLAQWLPD